MSRTLTLRGETWTISPLTFGQLRAHKDDLDLIGAIRAMPDDDQLAAVCRVVAAGLSKAHGVIDPDKVADIIDLENFQSVISALMGVSGLEARPTIPVEGTLIGTASTAT